MDAPVLQNLHTHSIYCDGVNTIEKMVLSAIRKNFFSVGFSAHSMLRGKLMEDSMIHKYQQEVSALKAKYKEQIEIFCGFEVDMTGRTRYSEFDYILNDTFQEMEWNIGGVLALFLAHYIYNAQIIKRRVVE